MRAALILGLLLASTSEASSPLGKVYIFLSARCPCSNAHLEPLKEIANEFSSQGFEFVGVHSNQDESDAEGKKYFKAHHLPFEVVRDEKAKLANEFGAIKTPHVFVVDAAGHTRYSGGIDDSKDPKRASEHYLRDALTAIAQGKEPATVRARALGCVIKRE